MSRRQPTCVSLFPVSRALPAPILRLLTFVALGVLAGPTYADADLWGHVRFGLDILSAGRLPSVDPYSFTSDVIWVNHEWLAEVLFALGYQWAGVVGLICIKLAVLAGVMALAARSLREDVPAPLVRDFFVGLIILLTFARTGAVRPQLFSVLLFTVLVVTLRSADRSGSRSVFCLPLVFALWANLHGAWITGLCVLGIWCALARWATAGTRAGLFFGCALATLVNPYGYGLWSFLNSTVGTSRPEIADWMPLFSMPWPIVAYECILPALAIFAIVKTRRLSAAYGAVPAGPCRGNRSNQPRRCFPAHRHRAAPRVADYGSSGSLEPQHGIRRARDTSIRAVSRCVSDRRLRRLERDDSDRRSVDSRRGGD